MAKRLGKSRREDPVLPSEVIEENVAQSISNEPTTELSLFDDAPPLVTLAPPITEIIDVEKDMTPDQRAIFTNLLDTKMTLEERADQLVLLAKMHGTKTAPVGLRAIMEINRLTGLSEDRATEAPAMFQLPENTTVSVKMERVEK